ncbi:MAG: AAA family ATPase [Chloroflexi bacterium]|nr:AAA family ATPase [Chloroflexota bacterium]
MQRVITDDLDALLEALPPRVAGPLRSREDKGQILEVVLDLGRPPEARFLQEELTIAPGEVSHEDIQYVIENIGAFGDDNRAGIERTLHRISAIRNRQGRIVGLTCRVGRAVLGTVKIIEDLVQSGRSILLLGRPGVGKTTMLREVARVLSDDLHKRVIVVDTSNEIAGDGDIPHPAIGRARRMQVSTPTMQHAVMIEAVENHMPQVIIIDEIGTELEAAAARTIAERGVQLVGTAHGNTLENLIMNPTLSDLVGGIQSVTLGDEEARRRGTQKSILERKAPPTFDVVVEIQDWNRVAVHSDVASVVDAILRGQIIAPEVRVLGPGGAVETERMAVTPPPAYSGAPLTAIAAGRRAGLGAPPPVPFPIPERRGGVVRVFPFGISRTRLEQAIRGMGLPVAIQDRLEGTDALITLKNYYRRKPQALRDAEARGVPLYVLKNHTLPQIEQALLNVWEAAGGSARGSDGLSAAMREAEDAIQQVMSGHEIAALSPQNAYIRRLQHQMAQRYNLTSRSSGREPNRRVMIFRQGGIAGPDEGKEEV